jgi:ribosomal protein S18 acetylase RimI-like enzyme
VAVVSAAAIPFDRLVQVFNEGYSSYLIPVQVDELELRHHIEHYDIDLNASRITGQNNLITGVGLLAVRGSRGWIGGLGVHPDYRRQGIGRALMQALIEQGRALGLTTIQLEVLEKNAPAHQLYLDMGFVDVRSLHVLDYAPQLMTASESASFEPYPIEQALQLHQMFHTVSAPWQRGYESLKKADTSVQVWIIPGPSQPLAYAVGLVFSNTIHLLDLACAPGQESALTSLIAQLHGKYPEAKGRIVNVAENEPGYPALSTLGWQIALSQHEMVLSL